MALEHRKDCRNITLKAAFIVAFFVSFFSGAEVDLSQLTGYTPKQDNVCQINFASGAVGFLQGGDCAVDLDQVCKSVYPDGSPSGSATYYTDARGEFREQTSTFAKLYCIQTQHSFYSSAWHTAQVETFMSNIGFGSVLSSVCPPDEAPSFTYPYDPDGNGQPDKCLNPSHVQNAFEQDIKDQQEHTLCNTLVLDVGNNSADNLCYTSGSGVACEVEKVTTNYGGQPFSYYQGVDSNPFGCSSSQNSPFDQAGIGNENDDCFEMNGANYCQANKDKHCNVVQGSNICDEGCFESQGAFYCDAARHPDVGEGDSDYFDDKGTCSVVAASAYKGLCEDYGGTWSKEGDYAPTNCPATSIAGSCSVATAGGCMSCLDKGGTWTPDENAQLTNSEKGIQDLLNAQQKTNQKSDVLENTIRKGNESLVSTVKTGNDKLLGELKTLNNSLNGSSSGGLGGIAEKLEEQTEKDTYTTTLGSPNKAAFNNLFSTAEIAKLETDIQGLRTQVQSELNTIRAEAGSILSITVPTSSGYQPRTLTLTQGTFDLSLSRFSDFFTLLAGPVLLLCSVFAAFILMGSKD